MNRIVNIRNIRNIKNIKNIKTSVILISWSLLWSTTFTYYTYKNPKKYDNDTFY